MVDHAATGRVIRPITVRVVALVVLDPWPAWTEKFLFVVHNGHVVFKVIGQIFELLPLMLGSLQRRVVSLVLPLLNLMIIVPLEPGVFSTLDQTACVSGPGEMGFAEPAMFGRRGTLCAKM